MAVSAGAVRRIAAPHPSIRHFHVVCIGDSATISVFGEPYAA